MSSRFQFVCLTSLAIIFALALTFATIEIPLILNRLLIECLQIPDYNPAISPDLIEEFIAKNNLRPIGYGCLVAVMALVVAGFATERGKAAVLGSFALFLPTFGHFVAYMFFLSGLGVLRLLWMPLWSIELELMRLGDIIYLPYMLVTYPLSILLSAFKLDVDSPLYGLLRDSGMVHYHLGGMHFDARVPLATLLVASGLFIFVSSSIAWFLARNSGEVADFWLYRYSRHPQYLGWIIWSYGVMLLASLTPVVRGGANHGASLPWTISSLIVICVALNEENRMMREVNKEYSDYRQRTPFFIPLPKPLVEVISLPFRLTARKSRPENIRELALFFLVYSTISMVSSLPFVISGWPSSTGWSNWPYMLWPFQ